jgi:hypothetical protein
LVWGDIIGEVILYTYEKEANRPFLYFKQFLFLFLQEN